MRKLKRGPAVILPKDAGIIIAYCGINKKSNIVEIGGGSGFLTVQIGRIAKKVTVYEKRKEFADIIKQNIEKIGLKNVKIINKEVVDKINQKNVDAILLDVPNAQEIIPHIIKNIKDDGGCMGVYALSVEQMKSIYLEMSKLFKEVHAIQISEKEFDINEKRTRPKHIGMLFSSYLIFGFRKNSQIKQRTKRRKV